LIAAPPILWPVAAQVSFHMPENLKWQPNLW
jgi:hypothetical protein